MILELNQSLYYLIGNSIIRLVVIDELTERTVSKIRSMRPSPSYYVIYANTPKMEELFKTVSDIFISSLRYVQLIHFIYFMSSTRLFINISTTFFRL